MHQTVPGPVRPDNKTGTLLTIPFLSASRQTAQEKPSSPPGLIEIADAVIPTKIHAASRPFCGSSQGIRNISLMASVDEARAKYGNPPPIPRQSSPPG